ncbi:U-scoloptoxin(16)-Er13a-like [Homarus americanus]|uniref:U-scoloptoxin(16)-Er13a-like n=1 Tax=Homarus americanus TaxID=6706 RepID=UPI001C490F58|nr:U-scoloptoxin(16)-Er13a-like [Homarus americanus]
MMMTGRGAGVVLVVGVVWVAALIHTIHAQEGHIHYVRADELRDHSGKCYDADRCSLRTTGESWTVDHTCERATCIIASNGTLLEKRTRCSEPPPLYSETCYIVRVEGRPYPDCCPQLYCNGKLVSFAQA